MYVFPSAIKKTKSLPDKIALAKQQLELDYWLSKALESGCFSLECGS
jgi:hypothetical protein